MGAQVYDVHVVRANPLQSIPDLTYFYDQLKVCERAKAAQLSRRSEVAFMLHDAGAIRSVLRLLFGPEDTQAGTASSTGSARQISKTTSATTNFRPWKQMESVKHAVPFVGIS